MQFETEGARALDTARHLGATYADVRFESGRRERTEVRNGDVADLSDTTTCGYGVRALCDGAWGFASSPDRTDAGIDATVARAIAIAKAGAHIARTKFTDVPTGAYVDTYVTPMERDPATVPVGERVALLLDAERLLRVTPAIRAARAWLDLWRTEKRVLQHGRLQDRPDTRADRERHLGPRGR